MAVPGPDSGYSSDRSEQKSVDGAPVPSPLKGLAVRLRQAVRSAGGNQVVADRSGVPVATVNNYVRGRNGMKIEPLAALAQSCGVSLQWLVYGGDPGSAAHAPGFALSVPAAAAGLSDSGTGALPGGTSRGLDLMTLAKAIEIVGAITGTAGFEDDPRGLARRIAMAYAVLMQPPAALDQ